MMERFKHYFNSILVFIFGFLLLGCQPNAKNTENSAMNQQPYLLHFGLQGFKDFAQYNQSAVDNHPVASFRELDFSPPNLGQIKIENGASSLAIDHVFYVLGTSFHKEDGIEVMTVNAGLNKEEFVRPEQAYQAYANLMKRVNQAGWKLYIAPYNPRIAKEDNMRYVMKWGYSIDPSYIFSYEEWQNIMNASGSGSLGYRLYANGLLLNIYISQTKKTEDEKEQYMVRYTFNTIRYDQRDALSDSENNINAYTMTPLELKQAFEKEERRTQRSREYDEKEAIAEGYRIDESYVGPDLWQYVK
ncbi:MULTISPECIES: hypothetical protein [Acinetobacter]|uniref:hypothetical protein n=1 Tax=Acinetobacter TaxID=469 RepID=UPI00148FA2C3|nr:MULTISPECIES: hypothetical protein [Acinetobacter]